MTSYRITADQTQLAMDIAAELDRLSEINVGSPPMTHLRQLEHALPDIALRLRALIATVRGQGDDALQARF